MGRCVRVFVYHSALDVREIKNKKKYGTARSPTVQPPLNPTAQQGGAGGSYERVGRRVRLKDFVYHSALGLRVMKKMWRSTEPYRAVAT